MPEKKLVHCKNPTDPERCQGSGKNGQCPFISVKGSDYCVRHGATRQLNSKAAAAVHEYRLNIWQERVNEFASGEHIKSLRGEIGILRMVLENVMNKCKNTVDLMTYSPRISDLVIKIDKLVISTSRLESKFGLMLDKSAALSFAGSVVKIISSHVDDDDTIDLISNAIIDSLSVLTCED